MSEKIKLNKEAFLFIAEASGLDIKDPHMDELFAYVQSELSNLDEALKDLDLSDVEPIMTFIPPER